jgi:hypothetical protein
MKENFEEIFTKNNGTPFIYNGKEIKMSDIINLTANKVYLKITFLQTNSDYLQGIVLDTKGHFTVNEQVIPNGVVLWENTAPKEIQIFLDSKDKKIFIYNVWDPGDGTMHYGHGGAALYVETIGADRIYYCNDGSLNDDFNDLVFKIQFEYLQCR